MPISNYIIERKYSLFASIGAGLQCLKEVVIAQY